MQGGERRKNVKQMFVVPILLAAMLVLGSVTATFAAKPPTPGQPGAPNQTCGEGTATVEPNGFSTGGFAKAGLVYAGSDGTPSLLNGNPRAISQYDVACFQLTTNN